MSVIIPRWEWRTFGTRFGSAEAAFAKLEPSAVHESDELYLLPTGQATSLDSVKIRDDLMDVKTLREVSANGLERWEPTLKVAFPLAEADVTRVSEALHLTPPSGPTRGYTLDRYLDEVVRPSGTVQVVRVHKSRVRYTVGGCMAEFSDVVADGRSTRTIAIESTDAAAVAAAVRDVGLDGFVNTSYPRGLAALIADRPPRYAVIDAGTNSTKFHVAERLDGGLWRVVVDRAEVTRLGEGLHEGGHVAPAALDREIVAIRGMVDEARDLGVIAIAAVGTAGLRAASDREAVLGAIRSQTGLTIEVISGEDEGRLAYQAVLPGLGQTADRMHVFDTGGGSTQFTFGHGGTIDEQFSVPVGAVRFTEQFGLHRVVSSDVLDAALAAIAAELSRIDGRPRSDALIGMGGAITNITAVKHGMAVYDPTVVQGTVLDRSEIDRQIELYRSLDADGRRSIVGLQPKRAEVILAGACIVRTVMDKLGHSSLTVSDRGLRHGVLAERFGL